MDEAAKEITGEVREKANELTSEVKEVTLEAAEVIALALGLGFMGVALGTLLVIVAII